MRALRASVVAVIVAIAGCSDDSTSGDDTPPGDPTWYQDVAPLVVGHCQSCHVDGGIAPFPLTTYEEAAPVARMMADMVDAGLMPPFGAVPRGDCAPRTGFLDDPRLSSTEIATLRTWADRGAPAGDAAQAAPVPEPPSRALQGVTQTVEPRAGWTTSGQEDEFICLVYDPGITTTQWLTGLEFRPTDRSVVHHAVAYADPTRTSAELAGPDGVYPCFGDAGLPTANPLGGYTPGALPFEQPAGTGVEVPAGSLIVVQMHYHPLASATPVYDATSLALRLTSTRPSRLAFWTGFGNDFSPPVLQPGPHDRGTVEFFIPAGVTDHTEQMRIGLPVDDNGVSVPLWAVYPHMHYVGTRMEVQLERADGSRECLIDAGHYDFNWQRAYAYDGGLDEVPQLRSGDTLVITCTYDNTIANPNVQRALDERGLSAPVDVSYGEDTLDEMCVLLTGVVLP